MLSILRLRKTFLLSHVPTECLLFTSHLYGVGAFEAQPGSGVQYFNPKPQKVQLHLRDTRSPSCPRQPLGASGSFLPSSRDPRNQRSHTIQWEAVTGLCAGSPVGTAMPYLFLWVKGLSYQACLTSLGWLPCSRWHCDASWHPSVHATWNLLSSGAGYLWALCVSVI